MIIIEQKDDGSGGFADENGNELDNVLFQETASTAANIKNYGLTEITSTAAKTYTCDAPAKGVRKRICNTAGTTTVNTVVFGSTVNSIQVGGSTTARKITFNAQNESVTLIGASATKWLIESINGGTIASS